MDLNIILAVVAVVAFVIAIYQTVQAKGSDKKLEEAQNSLKVLEDGMVLSDFKLKKAIEYYEKGKYNNSLEAFRKYSKESEDNVELEKALRNIFITETRKIYSNRLGLEVSPAVLVVVIITSGSQSDSKYPDYLNKLIQIYQDASKESFLTYHVPLLLNQENYSEVLNIVTESKAMNPTKSFSRNF